MMLRKAADQQGPPKVNITLFDREVKCGIPSSSIDTGLLTHQGLIDVTNYGCKSEGKHCILCMLSSGRVLKGLHNKRRCTQGWR